MNHLTRFRRLSILYVGLASVLTVVGWACDSTNFSGSSGRKPAPKAANSNSDKEITPDKQVDKPATGEDLTACQGQDASCAPGAATDNDTIAGDENKICSKNVDIVFSIDVSTSMSFALNQLHDGIAEVWESAEKKGYSPRFGFVAFVDDAIQPKSGAYESIQELQAAFVKWARHTSTNSNVTSQNKNFDEAENSLDSLALSAESFPWRGGLTTKIIFHATDAPFLEAPARFLGGLPVKHSYSQTASILVEKNIRLATFIGIDFPRLTPGFTTRYGNQEPLLTQTKGKAYNLTAVANRTLSMAQAINDFVIEASCTPASP